MTRHGHSPHLSHPQGQPTPLTHNSHTSTHTQRPKAQIDALFFNFFCFQSNVDELILPVLNPEEIRTLISSVYYKKWFEGAIHELMTSLRLLTFAHFVIK